eukprot:m.263359 g.263359  ORF g.263359 m.263359 type:complete len:1118 (+) comp19240_c3_seq1:517-3870(+)
MAAESPRAGQASSINTGQSPPQLAPSGRPPDTPRTPGLDGAAAAAAAVRRQIKPMQSGRRTPVHKRNPKRPSLHEFSQNLTSVLNDPRRPREPDLFTRDWGEAFVPGPVAPPPSNFPRIRSKEYVSCKARQSEFYEKHVRVEQFVDTTPGSPTGAVGASASQRPTQEIPEIFFRPDFDLSNPDTFKRVMQQSFDLGPATASSTQSDSHSTSRLLEERLSVYLDDIERQLASKIATRSDGFFNAMSTQEVLSSSVHKVVGTIADFRKMLGAVKKLMADANLTVLRKGTVRANNVLVFNKLKAMAAVGKTQNTIQLLLSTSEYLGALDLIQATQEILQTELAGIHAVRHLSSQLSEMEKLIDRMLEGELVQFLIDQLQHDMESLGFAVADGAEDSEECDGEADAATSSPVAGGSVVADSEDEFDDRMVSLVTGLLRRRKYNFLDTYGNKMSTFLKASLRSTVVAYFGTTASEGSQQQQEESYPGDATSWADSMRALNFEEWLRLMTRIFGMLRQILAFASNTHRTLRDLLHRIAPRAAAAAAERSIQQQRQRRSKELDNHSAPETSTAPSGSKDAALGDSAEPSGGADSLGSEDDAGANATAVPSSSSSSVAAVHDASVPAGLFESAPAEYIDEFGDFDDVDLPAEESEAGDVGDLSELDASFSVADGADGLPETNAAVAEVDAVKSSDDNAVGRPQTQVQQSLGDEPAGSEVLSPLQFSRLTATSQDVVVELCEQAHLRCSKLITSRSRDGGDTGIALASFVQLFRLASDFVAEGETLAGTRCGVLRGTILTQAKKFLARFHERQKEKLTGLLANERWSPLPMVPSECQLIVNRLLTGPPARCTSDARAAQAEPEATPATDTTAPRLMVGDQPLTMVQAVLMYVRMVSEYCQCASDMPAIAPDAITRLCEILRLFNVQTNSLVLRAGAIKLLGLQRITAKQLALAAQGLSTILLLLPCIETQFRALLDTKRQTLCGEFEKIKSDYAQHKQAIFDKLASMVDDVWDAKLPDMAWHRAAETKGMSVVATQTTKLYNALSAVLPPADLKVVFGSIVTGLNRRLLEACRKRDAKDKATAVGLAADTVLLEQRLSRLEHVPVERLRMDLGATGLVLPAFFAAK